MRKQYHFRPGADGLDAWDVDRLIRLSADVEIEHVPVGELHEVDTDYWFSHGCSPTVRAVAEHARLMQEADLGLPIILDDEGRLMDGMHRVARALLEERPTIAAKRFPRRPTPDYRDVQPDDLPYE